MDACGVQRRRWPGEGAARASVCIRHIYPDSGRAGSLTRPNARPAYVGLRDAHVERVSLVPPHRTYMQKANTAHRASSGHARFFNHSLGFLPTTFHLTTIIYPTTLK